jgi:hypothetical protein
MQRTVPTSSGEAFPDDGLSWASAPALARRLVSMGRAFDVAVVAARPHPGAIRWRNGYLEYAAHNDAILQHVVVVVAPLARWVRDLRALEDQLGQSSKPVTHRLIKSRSVTATLDHLSALAPADSSRTSREVREVP